MIWHKVCAGILMKRALDVQPCWLYARIQSSVLYKIAVEIVIMTRSHRRVYGKNAKG